MDFLSESESDGIRERLFIVGEATGALWTPAEATGPLTLLLIGHAERQNKSNPVIGELARGYVKSSGYAVAVLDAPSHGGRHRSDRELELIEDMQQRAETGELGTAADLFHAEIAPRAVREWRAALDALLELDEVDGEGPVGFWGVALGSLIGIPFIAEDARVSAAVLGLVRHSSVGESARRVRIPIEFLLQWDDEFVPRDSALELFDALGSEEKTLHANAGGHGDVPGFEAESARRFLARYLAAP